MYYLIYVSTAVDPLMDDAALLEILKSSRKNNAELQITGLLVYGEGTFIQVLEGEKEYVEYMYSVIEKDRRHKNLIKLISKEMRWRSFGTWSMAFKSIDSEQLKRLTGYIRPERVEIDQIANNNILLILKAYFDTNFISIPTFE